MKTRSYTITKPIGGGFQIVKEDFVLQSESSPKVGGKLILRANPHACTLGENLSWEGHGNPEYMGLWPIAPGYGEIGSNTEKSAFAMTAATNMAYARLRGKLYEGSASLGVTLGSYKQSADMIRNRASQLAESAEAASKRLAKGVVKPGQTIASAHLEYIFGWKPLLQDMWAACSSVIQQADKRKAVSGKGSSYFEETLLNDEYAIHTRSGNCTATISTMVTISNPNLWLLERAGLLNPAAVAWDLIPWSFVFNMVSNMGSLVNSITDFVGLSFDNESVTRTTESTGMIKFTSTYPTDHPFWGTSTSVYRSKSKGRSVGAIPKPSFQFKIPEANWETAAMAASLMVQRVSKLRSLLLSNK